MRIIHQENQTIDELYARLNVIYIEFVYQSKMKALEWSQHYPSIFKMIKES